MKCANMALHIVAVAGAVNLEADAGAGAGAGAVQMAFAGWSAMAAVGVVLATIQPHGVRAR